jgi:TATA-box binding protein (TBP) (component of TFIID and TFIIIB)
MTVYCKNKVKFNTKHIKELLPTNQFIRDVRPSTKKKNKEGQFYNQITIDVESDQFSMINNKIFQNGTQHLTGCKSPQHFKSIQTVLFHELKRTYGVLEKSEDNIYTIVDKEFVDDCSQLALDKIYDIHICMLNTKFDICFKINLDKLYSLLQQAVELQKNNYNVYMERTQHAAVRIKHEARILIFESGKILLIGTTFKRIFESYIFINKYLIHNYKSIHKVIITPEILQKVNNEIFKH